MMIFKEQPNLAQEADLSQSMAAQKVPEEQAKWQVSNVNSAPVDEPLTDFQAPIDQFLREEEASALKVDNAYFSSPEYLAMKATEKQDKLWEQISGASSQSSSFPSTVQMAGLFFESMDPTFSTKGDAMPKNTWWPNSIRTKFIHSVGVHGKVKFVSTGDHPYTGIFKGASSGIIRLSSAAKPTADNKSPLTPGMGLKFLRDGIDSANLVSMFDLVGTLNDWNFFSKDFTTHIPFVTNPNTVQKMIANKFATQTSFITQIGLSDFAGQDETGATEANLQLPFMLRFEPNAQVHTLFPKDLPSNDPLAYVGQLESVPAGATLYNVYAMSGPKELKGEEKLIGHLQLDGKMVKSKWGDENLLIRHQEMDHDVKHHPEWEQYLHKFGTSSSWSFFPSWGSKGFKGCPFLAHFAE